jgi:uncharacterized damage-inducible protein DinB
MNLENIRELFDYSYWARDVMLTAVRELNAEQFTRPIESSFKSVRDTIVHIYGAEGVWYSRWQGRSPAGLPSPDQFPDVSAIAAAWGDLERGIRSFIEDLGDAGLAREVEFSTLDGHKASAPFWQMAQHVVNHGSYHRGQVTTMLRQLGAAPPTSMDLIRFYRTRPR